MSEQKHTPGPWAYDMRQCDDGSPYAEIHPEGSSGWIGGRYLALSGPIVEADASLIAAAPELLNAARMARLFVDGEALPTRGQLLAALNAAIAKATGADMEQLLRRQLHRHGIDFEIEFTESGEIDAYYIGGVDATDVIRDITKESIRCTVEENAALWFAEYRRELADRQSADMQRAA